MADTERKVVRQNMPIDKDLIQMARVLSGIERTTIAEVIEDALRPALTRRYRKAIEQEHADLGGEAGGA